MQTKQPLFSTLPTFEKIKLLSSCLNTQKAGNLIALDIRSLSQMTDAVIIVTASSLRHAKALADCLSELARDENLELLRREGYDAAQWILVDMNDVIVHIFQDETRKLYNLETLWHEAKEL